VQTLIFGLTVALIGMGVVFVALYGLSLMISFLEYAVKALFSSKQIKKPEAGMKAAPAQVAAAKIEEDDTEIAAVISAAIFAYGLASGSTYRITNIKRAPALYSSPWFAAGRQQLMNERLSFY
jgi:sodium pump decarboxylase gamma subunit